MAGTSLLFQLMLAVVIMFPGLLGRTGRRHNAPCRPYCESCDKTKGLMCLNGRCRCTKNHVYVHDTCVQVVGLRERCGSTDGVCDVTKHLECDENGSKMCQCVGGYVEIDEACVQVVSNNVLSSSGIGTCVCAPGFICIDEICYKVVGHRELCGITYSFGVCDPTKNLTCDEGPEYGVCDCNDGFAFVNGTCTPDVEGRRGGAGRARSSRGGYRNSYRGSSGGGGGNTGLIVGIVIGSIVLVVIIVAVVIIFCHRSG